MVFYKLKLVEISLKHITWIAQGSEVIDIPK